ncbi:hypothetical protein SAMN02745121_02809 [Nannocystis exedens]|uniref:Uncharacterized protein n=2 Tax=Nannocystis exedens TaxID=54 RepID=A0A1I1XF45_9BACT|nr:hypothetical protein NAEX_06550 [Nannocystis exedens]SFE05952.1 hypothetical protein SAMN02745121_02809 [Nannocystis exedens]
MTHDEIVERFLDGDARGDVPAQLEELLAEHYRDYCPMTPELNAALHRLPPARFERFAERMRDALAYRETQLADSTSADLAEFAPPAVAEAFLENLVRNGRWAIERDDFDGTYQTLSRVCEGALGGGAHTVQLIERALGELAGVDGFATKRAGARLRLLLRRVRFMALRGTERSLELVLPGDDLRWVDRIDDALGRQEPLKGLTPAQRDTLFAAWSALDWDDTLGVAALFERDAAQPAIETRPWAELVAAAGTTSLVRLERGERDGGSLTKLFARPEPLADRIALAEQLAAFASKYPAAGRDAMTALLAALVPQLGGRVALTGALEKVAAELYRKGELDAVADGLEPAQRAAWDKPAAKPKAKSSSRTR